MFALRQTAEEQSAAFVLISKLLDTNALDYHARGQFMSFGSIYAAFGNSLRAPLAFNIFSINIPYPLVGSSIITCVTAPTGIPF